MSNENVEDVFQSIENDDFFQCFLQQNLKSSFLNSVSVSEQIKKLGVGIELLSQELHKQVLEKHDDLLRQASHATKLENLLNTMNVHVKNLFANAERLKSQIDTPYRELENHTKILSRLHLASHILRQVNRIQQLSKRLAKTNDSIQKATILQELEQLALDEELKNIEVVSSELRNIREHQQRVIKLGTISLNQGIKNENVSQTTTALQIFINLGTIQNTVEDIVKISLEECRECMKVALVTNTAVNIPTVVKTAPGRVNLSTSKGFREKLWIELEKYFSEDLYQQCRQVKFLQCILDNLNTSEMDKVAVNFWKQLSMVIQEEINNSSSAVQQTLEDDYPNLLKNYLELIKKLKYDHFLYNHAVLENFENSYLSNSLSRLLEPTQSMFCTESKVPSHERMEFLIRQITNELSVALVDNQLSKKISKNVSKCIKMFAVKTEQQLETGSEVAQVIAGNPNPGQIKNVQLSNALSYFHIQVDRMLSNMKHSLQENSKEVITESLSILDNLTATIIQPLISSTNTTIETIIVTLHQEPDWNKLHIPINKSHVSCSPYMRELVEFLTRVYYTYLTGFENKAVLTSKCNEISVRCIELMVRHSSILRPVSLGGRWRLQADFLQLENSLRIISPQITDLGKPYRLLKSFASLLIMSPEEILASQMAGSSIPHSIVLLLLFSHAGSDLASPHQNTGWSVSKLSSWLDDHPLEAERLDLMAGALQRYESLVRQSDSVKYDPVYPIMSKLLEVAFDSLKNLS